MILHTVLFIWFVALVAGIIMEKRDKARLLRVGTIKYVTHSHGWPKSTDC